MLTFLLNLVQSYFYNRLSNFCLVFLCTKENFHKLMNYMDYKKSKEEDTYIFKGDRKKVKKFIKFDKKENPFKKLLSLNIK